MKHIGPSELILNPDGSVYHINLKPEHVADNIIFVGDPARVDKIARYFDHIEFSTQKREFKTVVGVLKNTRFTVISTGIGPDNIDIVLEPRARFKKTSPSTVWFLPSMAWGLKDSCIFIRQITYLKKT